MIADYILNVPATTQFVTLAPTIQSIIIGLGAEWPSFPMIGTQEVAGRKLIHVRLNTMYTKIDFDALLAANGLDWQVYSIRSAYKQGEYTFALDGSVLSEPNYISNYLENKVMFLPFIDPIVVDHDLNITRAAIVSDIIYLSTYGGTDPIVL